MEQAWQKKTKSQKSNYLQAIGALYGNNITPPTTPKPKAKRKPNSAPERIIQCAIVKWCRSNSVLCHSIPNHGKRTPWAGEIERAMGLVAGVSDLFIAVPNNRYHGFYLEVKASGKKPTALQSEWMTKVRKNGYHAAWYDSASAAILAIQNYLKDR